MTIFLILVTFVLLAVGLAWYFIAHDHGEKEPIGALWLALAFGFVGGIAAAVIEGWLIPDRDISTGTPIAMLLLASLAVGVIEESCKFVPLSIYLYPKRYFNEHTDGVIYFALAGLGFGLPENILYTLQFGSSAGFTRILLTPLFHAATTGMVGYFLISAKLSGRSKITPILILVLAMIIHGLYDFGLLSGLSIFTALSIMITLTMSIMLFLLYAKATEKDRSAGKSVVGNNRFCRSCGSPNPSLHLYCTHCGKQA